MDIMEILARAEDADGLKDVLPKAQAFRSKANDRAKDDARAG